jgi:mannose-6-phosphate isomerase
MNPTAMRFVPAAFDSTSEPATVAANGSAAPRTERPWGWFETLATGEGYAVKRLRILAGRRLSLQRHQHRCEHWIIASGSGRVTCEGTSLEVAAGDTLSIPVGSLHRAAAGAADLEIIEVQRGELLSEEDIERFDDDFGRVVKSHFNL